MKETQERNLSGYYTDLNKKQKDGGLDHGGSNRNGEKW